MMKKLLVLASVAFIAAQAKEINLITDVIVKKNYIKVKVDKNFKSRYLYSDFFARYDDNVDLSQLDYSVQILPFISNVISIIWISGKTYYIDALDEEFYHSMNTVKKVFKRMYPRTKWNGELIPRKLVKNTFTPQYEPDGRERIALLFSGGLDSVTSSLYHRDKKQLLVTLNGHWDLPLNDKELVRARNKELRAWGKKHGHDNTFIDSNYYEFLNRYELDHLSREISSWRIFTVEGIGWAGVAAPVMALKGYQTLLHGSTITWEYNFPAAANPFIDDNIYFSGMRLKHDLFDMHRLGKCEYIAQLCKTEGIERPYIRVCEEKKVKNCCWRCQKCIRTIIELFVAGEDPRDYGFNCDVDKVLKKSKQFMKDHGTGSTTVWHFMHIQDRLKEMAANGHDIHPGLRWLLSYNLKNKITSEIANQRKIDWREYVDLLPDIVVPDNIEPAF